METLAQSLDRLSTFSYRSLDIPHDESLCIKEFDLDLCDLQARNSSQLGHSEL